MDAEANNKEWAAMASRELPRSCGSVKPWRFPYPPNLADEINEGKRRKWDNATLTRSALNEENTTDGDVIAANQDNAGADGGNRKVTYRSKKSLLR